MNARRYQNMLRTKRRWIRLRELQAVHMLLTILNGREPTTREIWAAIPPPEEER